MRISSHPVVKRLFTRAKTRSSFDVIIRAVFQWVGGRATFLTRYDRCKGNKVQKREGTGWLELLVGWLATRNSFPARLIRIQGEE